MEGDAETAWPPKAFVAFMRRQPSAQDRVVLQGVHSVGAEHGSRWHRASRAFVEGHGEERELWHFLGLAGASFSRNKLPWAGLCTAQALGELSLRPNEGKMTALLEFQHLGAVWDVDRARTVQSKIKPSCFLLGNNWKS